MYGPIQDLLQAAKPVVADMCLRHGAQLQGLCIVAVLDTPVNAAHLKVRMQISFNDQHGVLETLIPQSQFSDNTCVRDAINRLCAQELPAYIAMRAND
jgi:hypothetical protein